MTTDLQGNEIGNVKECHSPSNEECLNNSDIYKNCTCKRVRARKPFKRVLVHDEGVGHNVSPNIVMEIYTQNGAIAFREKRRKRRYHTSTADIYAWLVRKEALAAMTAKRKARKRS